MATPNSIANQPLRLQVNEKPSYFNKDTLFGFVIGSIIASPFLGGPVGAVLGGNMGYDRMQRELNHGKEIQDPTVLNKDLVIGAVLAPTATAIVGFSIAVGLAFSGLDELASAAVLVTQIATMAATPIGALIGGFSGKAEMQKEKSQAISQLQNYAMAQHFGKTQEPEIAQELDQNPSRHFTKMIEQQRAQSQATQIG